MTATVPRPRATAEVQHPPWCDVANCPLTAVAVGMAHQSRELPIVADGVKHGAVVLVQHANGPLQVSLAMRGLAWSPEVARQLAAALVRAADRADAESRKR